MNLARVDAAAGNHIATALTFLETLTRSPVVTWSPGQREAAMETVREARALMAADLLTLAQAVHEQRGAHWCDNCKGVGPETCAYNLAAHGVLASRPPAALTTDLDGLQRQIIDGQVPDVYLSGPYTLGKHAGLYGVCNLATGRILGYLPPSAVR